MNKEILKIIRDLHEQNPGITRYTCPICGGNNTLSISVSQGFLQYYCFRSSCGIKGKDQTHLTIREIVERRDNRLSSGTSNSHFNVPSHFSYPLNHPPVLDYLKANHCLSSYTQGLCDIRYDPKLDRVVFLIKNDKGEVVNATGRSLKHKDGVPKWFIYGHDSYPFVCGNSPIAVLVEDCASACSAASIGITSISLLGTNLKLDCLSLLKRFTSVTIALDRDALRKALTIQNTLRWFVPCQIRLLDNDLKKLNPQEVKEVLGL